MVELVAFSTFRGFLSTHLASCCIAWSGSFTYMLRSKVWREGKREGCLDVNLSFLFLDIDLSGWYGWVNLEGMERQERRPRTIRYKND